MRFGWRDIQIWKWMVEEDEEGLRERNADCSDLRRLNMKREDAQNRSLWI